MEIEISEKINKLVIRKSCKENLKKITILFVFGIILIEFLLLCFSKSGIFFLIYSPPFLCIIYSLICKPYKYEEIEVDKGKNRIKLSSSYIEKNIGNSMTEFVQIDEIKEIYVFEYHKYPEKNFFTLNKRLNVPHYRIHFIFGEDEYTCWGYEVPFKEAERIVKRLYRFLELNA